MTVQFSKISSKKKIPVNFIADQFAIFDNLILTIAKKKKSKILIKKDNK